MAVIAAGTGIDALVREAAARLAGSESARLDARLLMQHVTGLSHAELIAEPDRQVGMDTAKAYEALVIRRAAGEPLAQITGHKEFWGLPFRVSKDVLSPRPDSETLIELALDMVGLAYPRRVIDLGTGSGCLLGALLTQFPHAYGTALDISEAALAVARQNLEALGVADRVSLVKGDLSVAPRAKFDFVISNPPYIPTGDRDSLVVDVRDHEPALALFAGEDGLDAYRALAVSLPQMLAFRGMAVLEVGAGQAGSVKALMAEGFAAAGRTIELVSRADLGGHERAIGIRTDLSSDKGAS